VVSTEDEKALCECGHEARWHGPIVRELTDATYCRVQIGRVPYEECDCFEFRAAASLPAQQRPAPVSGAMDEVIERAARAAHDAVRAPTPTNWVGNMRDEYWFPIARAVLAVAQPAPPAETVSVLDGLTAEMRALATKPWMSGSAYIALVEAARQRLGGEQ
jgi:hypothetical protein